MQNTTLQLTFRVAQESDIPFLVESIIEAEKSGTSRLSYATVFETSETDVRGLLKQILEEDMYGQELCISGFLIAELDHQPVGACCAWIEGEAGVASAILKANLIAFYFGAERCTSAANKRDVLQSLTLLRETGTLQIESMYVKDSFRGNGINAALIAEHIRLAQLAQKEFTKVQMHVAATNEVALKAYTRAGFEVVNQACSDDEQVLTWLPAKCLILLEKKIN